SRRGVIRTLAQTQASMKLVQRIAIAESMAVAIDMNASVQGGSVACGNIPAHVGASTNRRLSPNAAKKAVRSTSGIRQSTPGWIERIRVSSSCAPVARRTAESRARTQNRAIAIRAKTIFESAPQGASPERGV